MSKGGKKFFCIANCLPVKSKAAKNHKNGSRRPLKDENDEPDCGSLADISSVEARISQTRQWLQDVSTNVNYDKDSTLIEGDSQLESYQDDNKNKKQSSHSSTDKRNSLNDSTAKPRLDSTNSSNETAHNFGEVGAADESALTSVSKCQHRRPKNSKRKLQSCKEVDGMSMASSCISLATERVTIELESSKSLGITIVGHTNGNQGDCGIFVGCVRKGGAAEKTGKVEPGDLIIEVNGIDLEKMENDIALGILKREMSKKGKLSLVLAKYWDLEECQDDFTEPKFADVHDFGYAYGHGSKEGTVSRNPSHLPPRPVEDDRTRRMRFEDSFEAHSSRMDCYNRPPSMAMQPYYHHPSAYSGRQMYPQMSPGFVDHGYHDHRKHSMAMPQYGFPPSNALPQYGYPPPANDRNQFRRPLFGSELIGWIQENIRGMTARNEARNYAQLLLDTGFVSSPDNKRFHEDGWYAIISEKPFPPPNSYY